MREGSGRSGTRGSSRAGKPSQEVPLALEVGGDDSTPTRHSSPSTVPGRRMAPLPRKVRLPTSIGVTRNHPSRARTLENTTSSVTKLASPRLVSALRPTATDTSVRFPTRTPIKRSQGRVIRAA